MARFAVAGSRTREVRLKALSLTKPYAQKDFVSELAAINGFVRDEIRYVRDVYGCETVQEPGATLEIGQGDCDDKSTLTAALAMAVGFRCRFIVLNRGGSWCHVWTQALLHGKWIDCETTEPVPCGATAPLFASDRFIVGTIDP